ncbi:hypothetical protein ES288_D09G144500v1, partial [Gossypium darwinii]
VGTKFKHLCLILNTNILLIPKCLSQILHKRISPQQDILLLAPLGLLLRTSASLAQRRKETEVSLKDVCSLFVAVGSAKHASENCTYLQSNTVYSGTILYTYLVEFVCHIL